MSKLIEINQIPEELLSAIETIPGCRAAAYTNQPRWFGDETSGYMCINWSYVRPIGSPVSENCVLLLEQEPAIRKLKITNKLLNMPYNSPVDCDQLSELSLPYVYFVFLLGFDKKLASWRFMPTFVKSFWRKKPVESLSDELSPSLLMNTFIDGAICMGSSDVWERMPLSLGLPGQAAEFAAEFIDCYWNSRFSGSLTHTFGEACKKNKPFNNILDWISLSFLNPTFILTDEWASFPDRNITVGNLAELLP